jgi:outer membrane protein assembly factor BamE (lipoprotein component of BamABCDE complex)
MLKKLATIFLIAFAAILAGCAGSGPIKWDNARQVKQGMSQQEVTALLGKPYRVSASPDGTEKWLWVYANGLTGSSASAHLTFKDGKVQTAFRVPDSF